MGAAEPSIDPRRAFLLVAVPLVAWEIFLRVDTRFYPDLGGRSIALALLGLWILSAAYLAGAVFGGLSRRLIRSRRWRDASTALVVAGIGAATFVGSFLGTAIHHAPELRSRLWIAALTGALVGLVVCGALRLGAGAAAPRGRRLVPLALAATVLVVGVGAFFRSPDLARLVLRRTTILGRAVSVAVRPWTPAWVSGSAEVDPQPLPPLRTAAPPESASLILLSVDTLRADAVSAYSGGETTTPAIDRLAADSVLFENAFCSRPRSAPSVASLMTGLHPYRHGLRKNTMTLGPEAVTLAELLSEREYETAAFSTNPLLTPRFGFGQGFETFEPVRPRPIWTWSDESQHVNDAAAVDRAIGWLEQRDPNEPTFLWLHLFAAHPPHIPPPEVAGSASSGGESHWFNVLNMDWPAARLKGKETTFDLDEYRRLYRAEVASVDHQIGRFVEALASGGWLDRSHLVLVADHGISFGEEDLFWFGRSTNRSETRVPLVWRRPGGSDPRRIDSAVQLADLVPTASTLLGLERPVSLNGRDLSGLIVGDREPDEGFAFTEATSDSHFRKTRRYAIRTRSASWFLDPSWPASLAVLRREAEEEWRPIRGSIEDAPRTGRVLLLESERSVGQLPESVEDLTEQQERTLRSLGYLD